MLTQCATMDSIENLDVVLESWCNAAEEELCELHQFPSEERCKYKGREGKPEFVSVP